MADFVVDNKGCREKPWEELLENHEGIDTSDADEGDDEDDGTCIELDDLPESFYEEDTNKRRSACKKKDDFDLNDTYLITNYTKEGSKKKVESHVDKILEKSNLQPGLEALTAVPVKKNKRALIRERKALREKTKGKKWYDLPATEVTREVKNDLNILRMRSALDNKHVYKKNDLKVLPKYFQVGKVVEGPADFYSGRIPKSQRKKTLVDELLADSQFRAFQKKKYKEIVDDNRRGKKRGKGPKAQKKKLKQSSKDDWLSWD